MQIKTSTSAPTKYQTDLKQDIDDIVTFWQQTQNTKPLLVRLESIQRICNKILEDFANELFDLVWTSDFCRCTVGLVGMRSPH